MVVSNRPCLEWLTWTPRGAYGYVYIYILVGGWTNPFEKYAREIGSFPQVRVKIPKIFETTTWYIFSFLESFLSSPSHLKPGTAGRGELPAPGGKEQAFYSTAIFTTHPGEQKMNHLNPITRWFNPCPFHPRSLEVTFSPLDFGSRELTIPKRWLWITRNGILTMAWFQSFSLDDIWAN